jgi:hypothetical protein
MLIGIVGGFGMYVLDLDANVSADSPVRCDSASTADHV